MIVQATPQWDQTEGTTSGRVQEWPRLASPPPHVENRITGFCFYRHGDCATLGAFFCPVNKGWFGAEHNRQLALGH